jgi:hypothetical protein
MSFTFDGANKLIICDPGVTAFTAGDLYSRWKDWVREQTNAKWDRAFSDSLGGDSLGGGASLGSYFFISNGWTIRPQEANHQLVVTGNLFPLPDTAPVFTATLGNFNVLITSQVSSLTQQVLTGGGGGADANSVADAVWNKNLSGLAADTAGDTLVKAKQSADIGVALSS